MPVCTVEQSGLSVKGGSSLKAVVTTLFPLMYTGVFVFKRCVIRTCFALPDLIRRTGLLYTIVLSLELSSPPVCLPHL